MTGAHIAKALGGAGPFLDGWSRAQCPAHASHGLTLALRDGELGLIVKCFAGCTRADILAELRRRGLLDCDPDGIGPPTNPAEIERRQNADARDRRQRIANALDLWGECYPAPGTIVERYWQSRGLTIPIPPTMRMHGLMHHRESAGRRPAMVALVEHVERGRVAVHLTYLAIDGSMQATVEPRKRSLGPVGGGAVRLAPAAETLLVAEGIETAASGMQACALPAWAALSTSGLMALALPSIIRRVIILADHDLNGAGERAARSAARRWLAEGRRVRIVLPPDPGTDFNDVLLGRGRGGLDVAA